LGVALSLETAGGVACCETVFFSGSTFSDCSADVGATVGPDGAFSALAVEESGVEASVDEFEGVVAAT